MIASVTIIDDNGNVKGVYELIPSRIIEKDITTNYVFEFEFTVLNREKLKPKKVRKNNDKQRSI